MAIDFPSSPTIGLTTTTGSKTWEWSGQGWKLQSNISAGTQGIQGLQGTQGLQGLQGIQGIQGIQGASGSGSGGSGTLSISTNTTNQEQYIPYAISFGSTTGLGATTSLVYNPSTGNLGIGTITPSFKLDVAGDVRVTSTNKMRFGGTSGTTNFYIQYNSTTNSLDFVAG